MAALEGMRLGSCVITRHIGDGGGGDVYLAEQPELGRLVAVKVVHRVADPGMTEASLAQATQQFTREARVIASLEHPHILPIYEVGEQDGLHYLIMPYIPDGSLADVVGPGPLHRLDLPLAPIFVATIIDQAAAGLQYAHDHYVVHRDVKPHNLLVRFLPVNTTISAGNMAGLPGAITPSLRGAVENQSHILLADFGLARLLTGAASQTRTTGTPLYTAPEQYAGQAVPATDQYALACVAYLLLCGQTVFSGTAAELYQQHYTMAPILPTRYNPLLPPAVDSILMRALLKDPAQRFPHVWDFAQALHFAIDPSYQMQQGNWPRVGPSSQALAQPVWSSPSSPAAGATGAPPPFTSPANISGNAAIPGALTPGTYSPPPAPWYAGPQPPYMTPSYGPLVQASTSAPDAPGTPLAHKPSEGVSLSRRTLLIGGAGVAGIGIVAATAGILLVRHSPTPQPQRQPTPHPIISAPSHVADTLGVYRSSTGTFYFASTITGPADISVLFGDPRTDTPVVGDWAGQGIDTVGVYRRKMATFYLKDSNDPSAPIPHIIQFGQPGDIPVIGDWQGNGRNSIGVFRPSQGVFYLQYSLNSHAGTVIRLADWRPTDIPIAGDWNGIGKDIPGLYRPSIGEFLLINEVQGEDALTFYTTGFGPANGLPFTGDWTGSGRTGIGVFYPPTGTMYLKNDATRSGPADRLVQFGASGDLPLAGHWKR